MNDEELKKLFHNLKNDLAGMSALTNLHRIYADRIEPSELIDRIQERQIVISTAYEKLYQNGNYPFVNLQVYIEELIQRENRTLAECCEGIRMQTEISDTELPLKKIMPLAQVAVELITNSYRHAFSDQHTEKEIHLSIITDGNNIRLEYSDNGIGLPTDLNPQKARSLGMQFIKSLSRQLGGQSTFNDPDKGMSFSLVFDI